MTEANEGKRRGRPPADGDSAKSTVIRLRVTPRAKLRYETLAQRNGTSVSELIEDMLREAAAAAGIPEIF